jgi:DNA-directed RNA polymerase specialized sigma24 family protein
MVGPEAWNHSVMVGAPRLLNGQTVVTSVVGDVECRRFPGSHVRRVMTLVEALRAVAPPAAADTEAEVHLREDAFAAIYTELHRLARAKGASREDAEDCASQIALAIAAAGPREPETCPRSEGQARGYLAAALRNRLIDRYRVARRMAIPDDLDVFPAAPEPEDEPDTALAEQLLRQAETVLYEEAVPAIAREARGRFDRDGFVTAITQLRAIHRDRQTPDTILLASEGQVTSTGRNRLYKQHERARTRLLANLPAWLDEQNLPAMVVTAVHFVVTAQLSSRVTSEADS